MEEDNEEGNGVIEEDYYAFLNVPRDAPNDEINNAYRRLSRIYHPDKHLDPLQKKEAEILFNKTKKAYEILSDPHKRAIYDSLGTRGLETEGWEIVQRTKTPQEIREEYERLAREREERRLQQRTNPRGNVTVNINATDLFSQYDEEDEYDYGDIGRSPFPIIEVSAMSLTQSIEAPLTLRDTLMMGGYLNTHNGTGSGAVTVSAKRFLSEKGWVQMDFSAGNGPIITMKGFRTLTKRIFGTAEFQLQFGPNAIRTGLETTLAMQLDKHTMGYLTWRGGLTSAMSTSIARDTEFSHFGASLLLGIPHSFVSINYTHKMKEQELRLRGALKAGTFGAVIEYSAEKKVSEHTSMSAGVSVGVPTGVSLKIKVTRASQSYVFPIHLCEEVMPSPIFYATVTPVIVYAILKKLVIDPIVAEQKERNKEKQREANKNRMAEKIREATAAVNLMSATFARIRSDEETRKGLVIVKALYGRILSVNAGDSSETSNKDEVIDVTIPLQCLVKDSKLVLHEASKSQLPGFFDPCVGEDKVLCVQYLFHNHLHETTIGDTEALRIPKQSHRVNPT